MGQASTGVQADGQTGGEMLILVLAAAALLVALALGGLVFWLWQQGSRAEESEG
jgi:flagellar basal body-associated protein FliL